MSTLATILGLCLAPMQGSAPTSSVVHMSGEGDIIALRALRTRGVKDLLLLNHKGIEVRMQDQGGAFAAAKAVLPWPGEHLAWDLADLTGNGLFELLLLHGDGHVTAQAVDGEGGFGEPRLLLESRSYLPRNVTRMRFARDINGDGRADLVLPAAGIFRVHVQTAEGGFAPPLEIEYEADVTHEVGNPWQLDGSFSQSISIPFFRLEDVDGDGRGDLVSEREERIDFYLARPTIAAQPTWSLELLALAESLPKRDGVNLDDLISNVDQGVKWSIEDVDGVAPRDLVLQLGASIRVYLGGSVSGTSSKPDQLLKISGNLLHYFLRPVQGDGLADLQLLRGERISLGRVLRWLILPGSIDFEFFTYVNVDGTFSRKPTRRNKVTLKIPRLLSLMEDMENLDGEIADQIAIPAQRADLDGDGEASDVVDFKGGEVRFFAGVAPEEDLRFSALQSGDMGKLLDLFVLDDVNRLKDGETKTIDLGNIRSWNFSPSTLLREATVGKSPLLRVLDAPEGSDPALRVLDLDGDGRDDVIAWATLEDGSHSVQLLVQAKP